MEEFKIIKLKDLYKLNESINGNIQKIIKLLDTDFIKKKYGWFDENLEETFENNYVKEYETLLNYSNIVITYFFDKIIEIGNCSFYGLSEMNCDLNLKVEYLKDLVVLGYSYYDKFEKLNYITQGNRDKNSDIIKSYIIKNVELDIIEDFQKQLEETKRIMEKVISIIRKNYIDIVNIIGKSEELDKLNECWEDGIYQVISSFEYEVMRVFDIEELEHISKVLYENFNRNELMKK